MSASLVGSEMCIRDRACSCGHRRQTSPRSRSSRMGGLQTRAWGRLRPVSYTHLTLPTICSV
eukprot:7668816-Alexandrium_andersonii.AAC.1